MNLRILKTGILVNVIVGKLNAKPSVPILVTCKILEKYKSIAKLFNDSMNLQIMYNMDKVYYS